MKNNFIFKEKKRGGFFFVFILSIMFLNCMYAHSQKKQVSGVVYDDLKTPLPGATITIKDRPGGVITNVDGEYSISIEKGDKLIFSFLGFENQEVQYTGQKSIDVTLLPKANELDAVTIVAFGKQKKESVIGSITTIKPGELKVPSSNLTQALAGRMAGMISYQRSGEPGRDNAEYFVRGATTFGYKASPLILIDGVELTSTDLARLQPDDIESFSIMKDATATALYGARGANGVILVTTKGGKEGPIKLNFRYERSFSTATDMVELADPVTYMKLHNEAVKTRDPLGALPYSTEKIKMTQDPNRNQTLYPALNWYDELFKDNSVTDRFNFNASGGGKIARYYLAGTWNSDKGMLNVDKRNNFNNNINFNRLSLRSNISIDATKTTEVTIRFTGNFDDYTGPIDNGDILFKKAMLSNPVLFPKYYAPDEINRDTKHILFGNYGASAAYLNPYADMVKGYRDESRNNIIASVELKQNLDFITEGFSARVMANTTRESFYNVSRAYTPFYYNIGSFDNTTGNYTLTELNKGTGTEELNYKEGDKLINTTVYAEAALNYNKTFADRHTISGMLIGIMREYKTANGGSLQKSLPYRNLGLSGRFTYALDNKYFTEFNFGYNGSERFSKNHRWGFFPSMGLGWMISNENFWKPIEPIVNKLKFKATYGLVGNDAIGSADDRFFYISSVTMNDSNWGYTFGKDYANPVNGVSIQRYSNSSIAWETAKMLDLGVEIGLFNKLDIQADYFFEDRSNILMDRSEIPNSAGFMSPLRANVGRATKKGFEVAVNYDHSFTSDFWASAMGNFTYAANEYKEFEEYAWESAGLPWKSHIGRSLSQSYGYIAERLFVDEIDITNSPDQSFFGKYMAGDIKYKDIDKDGKINENDIVPIGYPTNPEIIYGFGASVGYKDFDLSFFFQGSARSSIFIDTKRTAPFINPEDQDIGGAMARNSLLKEWADSYWSEDNRNIYARWPRLSDQKITNNMQTSTWFLHNGAFLRLKNVEIGYTLPKTITTKFKIQQLRFYLSGTNLLVFSPFKLWDPEMSGNGLGYPIQRVFNLGLNLNF